MKIYSKEYIKLIKEIEQKGLYKYNNYYCYFLLENLKNGEGAQIELKYIETLDEIKYFLENYKEYEYSKILSKKHKIPYFVKK